MDDIIGSLLAVMLMGVIVIAIKYGGALVEMIYKKTKKRLLEVKKRLLGVKYPVKSDRFPFKVLNFGDYIELRNGVKVKYQGKSDGKYYIESNEGKPFKGEPYMYATADFLEDNAIKLYTPLIIKWDMEHNIKVNNNF